MRSPLLTKVLALALLASTVGTAAAKVPVTGRRQFNLIPDALMRQLGESSYKSTLADVKLSTGNENSQAIKSVGQAIAKAANQKSYDWEFKLIQENDTINAWCMPGGKIAVYTGLLPVVKNEAGLAFVMGHEVGHATAHHGAERLSQQLAVLGGMGALYLYLDNKSEMSNEQKAIVVAAMGAGAQVGVILPFSRLHEKEADVIGMMYMAKAGYPPGESVDVWDRMAQASGGSGVPAFLSTHPSEDKRQENLKDWMPQAKKRYERNKLSRNTQTTQWTSSDFGGSSGGGGRKNNDDSSSGSGGASSGGTRR
ncbi:MAG: M48 family metallopeptidase [Deltaproteobacteria bacterium]|nr:M48 family metallopeptidase [Deltaproteobacteria bacterium]MBK9645803.1 M48 family metallopeptidase [Deltaproteobacteria bacterium]